ncbi:hypothetical protein DPEC_G00301430 [Dallia pectoralis]|uniref:Uncharacterized protein n=1 Tax=Dallia pectoralis TaxID=75939 RepID=A0ACC2FGV7_DALPE|nr:hypothetical protein DPEC_G00301430 [Dallia pectoralis]
MQKVFVCDSPGEFCKVAITESAGAICPLPASVTLSTHPRLALSPFRDLPSKRRKQERTSRRQRRSTEEGKRQNAEGSGELKRGKAIERRQLSTSAAGDRSYQACRLVPTVWECLGNKTQSEAGELPAPGGGDTMNESVRRRKRLETVKTEKKA